MATSIDSKISSFIFLSYQFEQHNRTEEFSIENAATKEELAVRNAISEKPGHGGNIHYVEIMRYPTGADVNMREWIKVRANFEKNFNGRGKGNKAIWIWDPSIG